MALDTYANLKAAVIDRVDNAAISDDAASDFITLAEKDIMRTLRVPWNQKRSTTIPVSAFVPLPTDYLSLVTIQYEANGKRYSLEQLSPHMLDDVYPGNTSGAPQVYAIHDEAIEIRPAFGSSNTSPLEITYYYRPVELSDSNTTNELLDNAPELLFYRAVAEGMDYMKDDQRAVKYMQMYENAMKDMKVEAKRAKWSGVPLRVRTDSMRGI